MTERGRNEPRPGDGFSQPWRTLIRDYQWIHLTIGIVGNVCFFVGSVLFLYDGTPKQVGVWLFIIGSGGMMVGAIGSALVKTLNAWERKVWAAYTRQQGPWRPDSTHRWPTTASPRISG